MVRGVVVLAIMRQRVGLGGPDAVADDSNAGHVVVILVLQLMKESKNLIKISSMCFLIKSASYQWEGAGFLISHN